MAPETTSTKVGILSLGDMGAGIARLLLARGVNVATNCEGRSENTVERARNANVELIPSDIGLVEQCSLILSVVPPRDAEATAQRILDALSKSSRKAALYFADLNAVAPSTCKSIALLFEKASVPVRFIDGCILGDPPRLKATPDLEGQGLKSNSDDAEWNQPSIPVSGPHSLSDLPDGERIASVLNFRSISPQIGAASGLKMCFAALSKGFTALATQSFATAHSLGVLDALKHELRELIPINLARAERGVPNMPPKAYRWVREMEEIAKTMKEEGGWDATLFEGVAGVYKAVEENEVLGKEKIGKRKRGTDLDDVAGLMAEGLKRKKESST